MKNDFYENADDRNIIKSKIVAEYFWIWAKIISNQKNVKIIGYVDLFCGPGQFDDGSLSTPLLILQKAISDDNIRQKFVCIFNDKNNSYVDKLKEKITDNNEYKGLIHSPQFLNEYVGTNIFSELKKIVNNNPTFFFIDPWGYKGVSLELLGKTISGWGCECLFFFNYNRILPGLSNDKVADHMNSLFGLERANDLRKKLSQAGTDDHEMMIVEEMAQSIKEVGGKFVLPFRFINQKQRTSHHLIFVSKHPLGYTKMKEVMRKHSTQEGSFEYNKASVDQHLLFALTKSVDELPEMLLDFYNGKTLTVKQIVEGHHIGTPFIEKDYKVSLLKLEKEDRITASSEKRKLNTMGDKVLITFPK